MTLWAILVSCDVLQFSLPAVFVANVIKVFIYQEHIHYQQYSNVFKMKFIKFGILYKVEKELVMWIPSSSVCDLASAAKLFCQIFIIFDVRFLYRTLVSWLEFHENWFRGNHTLLKCLSKGVTIISVSVNQFWNIFNIFSF